MMRLALFSLILCAFAIGLSEQDFFKSFSRCFRSSKQLSQEEIEIKELGDYLKSGAKTGKDSLKLITEFASKSSSYSLANSIKNLDPTICDEGANDRVMAAYKTIDDPEKSCHIERQAEYVREALSDFNRRVYSVCLAEEQKKRAEEQKKRAEQQEKLTAEVKEPRLNRLQLEELEFEGSPPEKPNFRSRRLQELETLGNLLAELGSDPSLESQIQLIASKGANNLIAALFTGLSLGDCDLAGIRAANEAQEEMTRFERFAPYQVNRLSHILDRYKQEMIRSCLDHHGKAWQSIIGDLALSLTEYLAVMSAGITEADLGQDSLEAADMARAEVVKQYHKNPAAAEEFFKVLKSYRQQILEAQLERSSKKWAAGYVTLRTKLGERGIGKIHRLTEIIRDLKPMDVRKDLRMLLAANVVSDEEVMNRSQSIAMLRVAKYYKPCEDLLDDEESIDALESFYALAAEFDPQAIESAIGELGGERSKLAVWVGRWRVCDWLVASYRRPKILRL